MFVFFCMLLTVCELFGMQWIWLRIEKILVMLWYACMSDFGILIVTNYFYFYSFDKASFYA